MNFAKFQKLVEERTGFRTMEHPTASGDYFSDSCGDLYTFFISVGPDEMLDEVTYFTTGCGFGTATSSIVVELAAGKSVDEAYAISEAEVMAALDGYPEKKKDYPERSLAALRAAIDAYRARRADGSLTDAMLAEDRARFTARSAVAARAAAAVEATVAPVAPQAVAVAGPLTISLR